MFSLRCLSAEITYFNEDDTRRRRPDVAGLLAEARKAHWLEREASLLLVEANKPFEGSGTIWGQRLNRREHLSFREDRVFVCGKLTPSFCLAESKSVLAMQRRLSVWENSLSNCLRRWMAAPTNPASSGEDACLVKHLELVNEVFPSEQPLAFHQIIPTPFPRRYSADRKQFSCFFRTAARVGTVGRKIGPAFLFLD